ncbi:MAG: hypothetical protein WA960_20140 [Tunicatimonas sp.]
MRLLFLSFLLPILILAVPGYGIKSSAMASPVTERTLSAITQPSALALADPDTLPPSRSSLTETVSTISNQQRLTDSLQVHQQHLNAQQDSLLRPLDSLATRFRQKVNAVHDTLNARVSRQPVVQGVPLGLDTNRPNLVQKNLLAQNPLLSADPLKKVAPELPSMPQPVHAVQEHRAAWQQKLSKYPGRLAEQQSKAASYRTTVQQGGQALEGQVMQLAPGSEQLQAGSEALGSWQDGQALTAEEQQARLQEEMLSTAQDHFADHRSELQSGQGKLQDLKKKYRQVQASEEVYVKKESLKGIPFGQRLTYGGTLQVIHQTNLAADLSPLLGYHLNRNVVVGIGATYRLAVSEDYRRVLTGHPVYGGRGFGEYTLARGFMLHGEYERLRRRAPLFNQEVGEHAFQNAVLVGAGKHYTITKRVRGMVLLLYNLRAADQLPGVYVRPYMVRFGFFRSLPVAH